jgi:hypothetical protein
VSPFEIDFFSEASLTNKRLHRPFFIYTPFGYTSRESSYGRIVGDEERTRSKHFFSVPCRNRPLSFDIGLSAGLHRAFLPSTIDPMELPLSCTNNLRDWEAARVTALSLRKLCNGNGIVIGSLDHRYVTPLRGEGCVS